MTDCTIKTIIFPGLHSRKAIASFASGNIMSNRGSLIIREANKKIVDIPYFHFFNNEYMVD